MSWRDVVCLCAIIIGVLLFLYGSNYYNAVVGWTGVSLVIGVLFAEIILKVHGSVRKKKIS